MSDLDTDRAAQVMKLTDELKTLISDPALARRIADIQRRLTTPMQVILDKVPGRSHSSKARLIGVSRPSYYDWINGESRPSLEIAQRLAKITGFSIAAIRGLDDAHPAARAPSRRRAARSSRRLRRSGGGSAGGSRGASVR